MQNSTLPARCRFGRRQAGYTQEQVANLLGWSVKTISQYENQEKSTLRAYIELAKLYAVSLDWLLTGADNKINNDVRLASLIADWEGFSEELKTSIFQVVQQIKRESK